MTRVMSLLGAMTAAPLTAVAEDAVFAEGIVSPSESFGRVEGALCFAGATVLLIVVFALIARGRSVHRKAAAELAALERLLSEVDR